MHERRRAQRKMIGHEIYERWPNRSSIGPVVKGIDRLLRRRLSVEI